MATLALRLCGGLELSVDGKPIEPSLGSKTLALLAFLRLERGPHRREALTALLWGEYADEKAKTSFRQALTRLRDAGLEGLAMIALDAIEDPAAALDALAKAGFERVRLHLAKPHAGSPAAFWLKIGALQSRV